MRLVLELNELVHMVEAQNTLHMAERNIYSKSVTLTSAIGVDRSVRMWSERILFILESAMIDLVTLLPFVTYLMTGVKRKVFVYSYFATKINF